MVRITGFESGAVDGITDPRTARGTRVTMVSSTTRNEIEAHLGVIPAEMEAIADPVSDHMWNFVRDLQYSDTELSAREKALVGLGASAAIKEPFCIRYYRSDTAVQGLTTAEIREAVTIASSVQFFSTILQGNEIDFTGFCEEVDQIARHSPERDPSTADD